MPLKKKQLTFIERVRKEYGKEYGAFIAKVKSLSPDEIIKNALEIAVKSEIFDVIESADAMNILTEAQKTRLSKYPNLIDTIYCKWNTEKGLDDAVDDFILNCITK